MMRDSSNENSNDNSNESNIVHRCVNRIEQDLVPIYSAGHLVRTLNRISKWRSNKLFVTMMGIHEI